MGLGKVLGSATGGFLSNVAGALYGNYASAKAATKAFDRDVWMMSNRYQLQVDDMKKAGLNPMLAAGASPPSPNAPMAQQRGVDDIGGSTQRISSAVQARAAAVNMLADAELKRAQAMTERNRPENVEADTSLKRSQAGLADTHAEVNRNMVANIVADTRLKGASAAQHEAQTAVAYATLPKIVAEIAKMSSETDVYRLEAVLKGLDASKAQALQPYLIQLGIAESYLKQLSLPEAEAMAKKWRSAVGNSALPWLRELAKLMPGFGVVLGGK